jgi:hypothetical protein
MSTPKKPAPIEIDLTQDRLPETNGVEEMPSITSLLERRKLKLNTALPGVAPPKAPVIERPANPAAAAESGNGPKIIPFRPRNAVAAPPALTRWQAADLARNADPLAQRVQGELTRGAHLVVFLAVSAQERSPKDPTIPIFVAQAYVAEDGDPRPTLLQGMRWDPTLVPQIWNALRTQGHAEFLPPATQTDISSERNAIRAALASEPDERVTMVRIDDGKDCRGVLILYSSRF